MTTCYMLNQVTSRCLFDKASTTPYMRPAKHVGDPFDVPTPFAIDPSLNEDDGNPWGTKWSWVAYRYLKKRAWKKLHHSLCQGAW